MRYSKKYVSKTLENTASIRSLIFIDITNAHLCTTLQVETHDPGEGGRGAGMYTLLAHASTRTSIAVVPHTHAVRKRIASSAATPRRRSCALSSCAKHTLKLMLMGGYIFGYSVIVFSKMLQSVRFQISVLVTDIGPPRLTEVDLGRIWLNQVNLGRPR